MIDYLPELPLNYRWRYGLNFVGTPTIFLEKKGLLHWGFLKKKTKISWEEVDSQPVFPHIWGGQKKALSQSSNRIMERRKAKMEAESFYGIYEPVDTGH